MTRKLKSKTGASLILALMLLLVCVTLASLILTAASANLGRARSGRDEQQAYMTVSSAAKLIKSKLPDSSWTETGTTTTSYTRTNEDEPWVAAGSPSADASSASEGDFNWLLEPSYSGSETLSVTSDMEGIQEVTVTVTRTGDVCGFRLELEDGSRANCALTFEASVSKTTSSFVSEIESEDKLSLTVAETTTEVYAFDMERSQIINAD